ncbi:MAG: hypothetical protein QNJ18_05795 [Xenococcaceae cyanobacterium MO_167.B52]|nr:hypothetical protein [Xenococcaceae cyanobacterium MO_167.B52]
MWGESGESLASLSSPSSPPSPSSEGRSSLSLSQKITFLTEQYYYCRAIAQTRSLTVK